MIYDEQLFSVDKQAEDLLEVVKKSATFQNYLQKKREMYQDPQVENLRRDFLNKKESFEFIDRLGDYAPDRRQKQRELRNSKRTLDLHPKVAAFRYAETRLQTLLDEIALAIARTVSDQVKVDTGSPFFETKSTCREDCHVR